MRNKLLLAVVLLFVAGALRAQQYTLLIKDGHVIDPKNGIDAVMDIAVRGDSIAKVAARIDPKLAAQVVNAKGLYVMPGLIDLHSHNFYGTQPDHYLSDGFEALPPDGFTFRCGVTTVVDAGGAGWKSFNTFKAQVIDHSKTRVLSFLNIVGEGMRGGPYEQNLADMDARATAFVAQHHREIVGIKVAHYSGAEWDPVDRALEAGRMAHVPVMIDFGGHVPPLPLEDLLMKRLRPGDIFTHTYARVAGRMPVIDDAGNLLPFIKDAQRRGVIFDVGHGGGSFLFSQAAPALKLGFLPNTISTDIHTGSMNAGMKDISNVMSKFLVMGMPLADIVAATTWKPATVINMKELGHLSESAVADIAIFSVRKGKFGFIDSGGFRMDGDQKLECELTVRAGKVVYDLNGISRPLWPAGGKL